MPEKEPVYFKEFREHIDVKFESMDIKFDNIDTKLESMDRKFDNIDTRFESMDRKFDNIDTRFESMDRKFDGMDKNFQNLENRLVSKIESEIESLAIMTAKGFKEVEIRFDGIDSEISDIKHSIGTIERYIGRYEVRAQNLEGIVNDEILPKLQELNAAFLAA